MKKSLFSLSLLFCLSVQAAVSLEEAFKSAWDKNEIPKIQRSKTQQLEETLNQGKAVIQPQVSLEGSYSRFDPGQGKSLDNSHSVRLHATQTVFHGLKEFHAIDASRYSLEAQKELEIENRLGLYGQVSTLFYTVLNYQSDLRTLDEQLALTRARSKELQERVRIGKSRRADLLSSEAQKSSLQAQMDATKTSLLLARKNLATLTELPEDMVLEDLKNELLPLKPLEVYTARLEERPDIKALKNQAASSQELVGYAKAGHLPNLDLAANYYLDRSGTPKPSQWDVGATVSLPLYSGGETSAKVREALEKQNEKSLVLSQARKEGEKEIRSAYESLKGNLSQLSFYKETLKNTKDAYEAHQKDYRFGLSTLLDVIQAQNNFLDAQKSYERVRYQTQISWTQLLMATADESLF